MTITKEITQLNVDLSCDMKCEDCEKFFECERPEKQATYRSGRMNVAKERMSKIKKKLVVVGGKGGVGKSLIAANLAMGLSMRGRTVSILDQNFDGPVIHKMLGMEGMRLGMDDEGIIPAVGPMGIQVVSTGLLLEENEVLTWFHDLRRNATEEFLCHTNYGERDYLITDIPAGTSSDTFNILYYIPQADGVVVVTIPTEVSQGVARKAIIACQKANLPILGVIENMSGFYCTHCGQRSDPYTAGGGQRLAELVDVPFLGTIPLERDISVSTQVGDPFVHRSPALVASQNMNKIIDKIEEMIGWGKV
ncbi:MAG: ATP-binding protein [Syntrophales bacterium]|nr:ATP-binding protein [Syntrophales bacterium]